MAHSFVFLRRFGSPRQLAPTLYQEIARRLPGRSVAWSLLHKGHDCSSLHQYLAADVHESIEVQKPCEDERVRGRRPRSCSSSRPDAKIALCNGPPADALPTAWKRDTRHASDGTAGIILALSGPPPPRPEALLLRPPQRRAPHLRNY